MLQYCSSNWISWGDMYTHVEEVNYITLGKKSCWWPAKNRLSPRFNKSLVLSFSVENKRFLPSLYVLHYSSHIPFAHMHCLKVTLMWKFCSRNKFIGYIKLLASNPLILVSGRNLQGQNKQSSQVLGAQITVEDSAFTLLFLCDFSSLLCFYFIFLFIFLVVLCMFMEI